MNPQEQAKKMSQLIAKCWGARQPQRTGADDYLQNPSRRRSSDSA
jgi:hypothetical protein